MAGLGAKSWGRSLWLHAADKDFFSACRKVESGVWDSIYPFRCSMQAREEEGRKDGRVRTRFTSLRKSDIWPPVKLDVFIIHRLYKARVDVV